MRETEKDVLTRSHQTSTTRSDVVATAELADVVEVIDASGVSWLATLDEWSRNAAEQLKISDRFD